VSRFSRGVAPLAKKKPPTDFESALKELESLVEKMERGDIRLEESLQYFERGIELTRHCQQALQEAEQKVQILLEKGQQAETKPFSDED
jgi:exodeoxyribonuclease VII small subunit